jgi:hypothetical protein
VTDATYEIKHRTKLKQGEFLRIVEYGKLPYEIKELIDHYHMYAGEDYKNGLVYVMNKAVDDFTWIE